MCSQADGVVRRQLDDLAEILLGLRRLAPVEVVVAEVPVFLEQRGVGSSAGGLSRGGPRRRRLRRRRRGRGRRRRGAGGARDAERSP